MNLASAAKKLLSLASAAVDRVNPIVVKEFRQAVQNRLVGSVLVVFLIIDAFVMGTYLLGVDETNPQGTGGRTVFLPLLSILLITCIGFVPLYAGVRLSLERNDANIDLLFVTTITPAAIVRGKFLTATALTLLIFSASTPFLTLTYLLRGIDLPTIFFMLGVAFCACVAANALGVFVGCVPGSWFIRGLVGLGALLCLCYMAGGLIELVGEYARFGRGIGMSTWDFWRACGSVLVLEALAVGLLHVLSIAMLSPKPSNRMLVPRVYFTGAWVLSGVIFGLWCLWEKTDEPLAIWVVGCGGVFTVMLLAAMGERDAWGTRVRRTIPRDPLGRLLAFVFYTGSAGGVAWCALMLGATALVALAGGQLVASHPYGPPDILFRTVETMVYIFGYFLCYSLTATLFRTVWLKERPTAILPLIALMIGAATSILPFLFVLMFTSGRREVASEAMIFNPFVLAMGESFGRQAAPVVLVLWGGVSLFLAAPWYVGQWRRFTHCGPSLRAVLPAAPIAVADDAGPPAEVAAP